MTSDLVETATRLCAACGMCCNGVLFHIVRLQPEDSAQELASLGLKLRSRHTQPYFKQPCPAYHESSCAIYARRPQRCRVFVCRQLQLVAAGERTEAEALETIQEAVRQVTKLRELFVSAGNTDHSKPLATRYEHLLTEPGRAEALAHHAQIISEMQSLEKLLADSFRVSPRA